MSFSRELSGLKARDGVFILFSLAFILTIGLASYFIRQGDKDAITRYVPFLSALAGSMMGFIGSYYVSEVSSRRSQELQRKANTNALIMHLKYTYEILHNPKFDVEFGGLLLDENWFIRITDSDFSNGEKEILFEWFKRIKVLSSGYGIVKGVFADVPITAFAPIKGTIIQPGTVVFCFQKYYDDTEKLINKYK